MNKNSLELGKKRNRNLWNEWKISGNVKTEKSYQQYGRKVKLVKVGLAEIGFELMKKD